MFRNLQCVQKGKVSMPDTRKGAAVHADDFGGVWVVSGDGQDVSYYTPDTLASAMEQRPTVLPSFVPSSSSSSHMTASPPVSTLAFRCPDVSETAEAEGKECVHSVLFFNSDAAVAAQGHRRDMCAVTNRGTLAFLRVPAAHDEPPPLLQPYQEVHLDLHVVASTATANAVILCCFDGEFTEVVRTVVVPAAAASSLTSSSSSRREALCPHHSDAVATDAMCTCEVEAIGLFRVQGRIDCILYDAVRESLIAISDAGNVDVWDAAAGRDATAQYGSPAWSTAKHGTATCAIVCRDRLWIGLTTGQLLIFSFAQTASPGEGSVAATLLRSHSSTITGLIPMSMQASVWSCAAYNGKVNVWDASDASFRGSFVFPEAGVRSWYTGVAQIRTALWGIDGASGEPCLLHVTESLSRQDAYVCGSHDARMQHTQDALLDSYRVWWRSLLRHFSALPHLDTHAAAEEWREEPMTTALQRLAADGDNAGNVIDAVWAVVDIMNSLQRLCSMDQHLRGDDARSLVVIVQDILDAWPHRARVQGDVDFFLRSLNAKCGRLDGDASNVSTLEEAQEEFCRVYAHVEELTKALAEADQRVVSDAVQGAVEEATDRLERDVATLQDALREAEMRSDELSAQLQEAREEVDAAQAQQRHMKQLLEDTEAQLTEAKKSLLATKRAAEVTASEVSSVFDMESKLHASQHVISELSAKIETLANDAQAKEDEIQLFRTRQGAAREVLQRVLHTQNIIADDVSDYVEAVDALIAETATMQHAQVVKPLKALFDTIKKKAFTLEASMESHLQEQQTWFRSLSQELKTSVM